MKKKLFVCVHRFPPFHSFSSLRRKDDKKKREKTQKQNGNTLGTCKTYRKYRCRFYFLLNFISTENITRYLSAQQPNILLSYHLRHRHLRHARFSLLSIVSRSLSLFNMFHFHSLVCLMSPELWKCRHTQKKRKYLILCVHTNDANTGIRYHDEKKRRRKFDG